MQISPARRRELTMKRHIAWLSVLGLWLTAGLLAAQEPPLVPAQGTIEKADRETLTVRTREPDGRFGKTVVLKLTGTSKVTTLTVTKRGNKPVLTQKDTEPRDLMPRQAIAFVYTTLGDSDVLLTAVVQPLAQR
jgi:hypothetical protein